MNSTMELSDSVKSIIYDFGLDIDDISLFLNIFTGKEFKISIDTINEDLSMNVSYKSNKEEIKANIIKNLKAVGLDILFNGENINFTKEAVIV